MSKYALLILGLLNFGVATMSFAEKVDPQKATPSADGETLWYDCKDLLIEGKGWTDTETFYARLPAKAKGLAPGNDYNLALETAGICVFFTTDAPAIQTRWTVTKEALAMPHMPATGVSGTDLYGLERGKWMFIGNGRPLEVSNTITFPPASAEKYLLYLPLYNGVKSIEIGIPKNCSISKPERTPSHKRKPLVFYGTSINQGACASRPGMACELIAGRQLDIEVLDLGFNGSGRMEPIMAEWFAELDPSVYILDGLWNMTPEQVAERAEPFVATLRKAHPTTPILLVEDSQVRDTPTHKGNVLRGIFDKLRAAGDKNLYFLSNVGMMGEDGEGTVDGAHPNDLGMMRKAGVFAKAIRPLLADIEVKPGKTIAIDDPAVRWSPYTWNRFGKDAAMRADATMPGAYVKLAFKESSSIRVLIDGTANDGCPPTAMPIVDYSIDFGEFKSVQLVKTGEVYSLPLAESFDAGAEHRLDLYFRSASLGPNRWQASTVHLRLAGFSLDEGGSLVNCPIKPKRAIGFGDSITEGVANEGSGPYYSNLMANNARATWLPLVCNSLDCEYGQLGTGGQGMVKPIEIPPLPKTWDRYDEKISRLTDGLLTPEPDYVFCAMGTNDHLVENGNVKLLPIGEEYTKWLSAVRKACPHAKIFCIVPPLGWHDKEIAEAVAARNQANDRNVFLIDTAPLKTSFGIKGATQLAPDGVHPSVQGNAVLGAFIAIEAQKILSREK